MEPVMAVRLRIMMLIIIMALARNDVNTSMDRTPCHYDFIMVR